MAEIWVMLGPSFLFWACLDFDGTVAGGNPHVWSVFRSNRRYDLLDQPIT